MEACAYCAEETRTGANVCRYCGRDLLVSESTPVPSNSGGDIKSPDELPDLQNDGLITVKIQGEIIELLKEQSDSLAAIKKYTRFSYIMTWISLVLWILGIMLFMFLFLSGYLLLK